MALGVSILNREAPPARGTLTDTGQAFMVGLADRGSTSLPIEITSFSQFTTVFGPRPTYSVLSDVVETFFREGGARVHVARVVGPAATVATIALQESATTVVDLNAASAGEWGEDLRATVTTSGAGRIITITSLATGLVLETSPVLLTKQAILDWGAVSTIVDTVSGPNANLPANMAITTLSDGTDDRASIVDANWATALARFVRSIGPGQVAFPGRTTTTAHNDLLTHAAANNRVALLDAPDSPTVGTLTSASASARAHVSATYGMMVAPHVQIPGVVAGTTRTVPYSAVQAGLEGRRDSVVSPNVAAAGPDFPLTYAVSLSTEHTDADRITLLDAGVVTAKTVRGTRMTYGYRAVAVATSAYVQFNHGRLRMAISAQAEDIGEGFMFDQIDARKGAEFGATLSAMLMNHYLVGALYGTTPDEAFRVDAGATVNTPATIAAGELRAVASVRMSPHAESVIIEIVKTAITQGV